MFAAAPGSIGGRITDDYGRPIVGATIMLHGTSFHTRTGFDGVFHMTGVPARSYNVAIHYPGTYPISEYRSVQPLGTVILNARLRNCGLGEPLNFRASDSLITLRYSNGYTPSEPVLVRVFRLNDPVGYVLDDLRPPTQGTMDDDDLETPDGPFTVIAAWEHRSTLSGQNSYVPAQIAFPLREPGVYVVEMVSSLGVMMQPLVVSNVVMITKTAPNKTIALLVNATTGRRVTNFPLYCKRTSGPPERIASNRDGILTLREAGDGTEPNMLLVGELGGNLVMANVTAPSVSTETKIYVHTDRPVYRPGQKVNYRGAIRTNDGAQYSVSAAPVFVEVRDASGKSIKRDTLRPSDVGTFNGSLTLADAPPLGNYTIVATTGNKAQNFTFSVLEYKKPEFSVEVKPTRAQYSTDEKIEATVRAKYYFGSPVANGDVEYLVFRSAMPSAQSQSNFGPGRVAAPAAASTAKQLIYTNRTKLGADGTCKINYAPKDLPDGDYAYEIQAKVVDNSRRVIIGGTSVMATRSDFRLALTADKNYYNPRERAGIRVAVQRFDGKPSGGISVKLSLRKTWDEAGARKSVELWKMNAVTDSAGRAVFTYPVTAGGIFELAAEAADSRARTTSTAMPLYIAGPELGSSLPADAKAWIIPERADYLPGEVVNALVLMPSSGIDALVTAEGTNIEAAQTARFTSRASIVSFPAMASYAPNFYIGVAVWTGTAQCNAATSVNVTPLEKQLRIELSGDRRSYRPGDTGSITVRALDGFGRPAADADIALAMVDDAVFAIAPDNTTPIFAGFYEKRANRTSTLLITGASAPLTHYTRYGLPAQKYKDGDRNPRNAVVVTKQRAEARQANVSRTTLQGAVAITRGRSTAGADGFSIRGGRATEASIRTDGVTIDDVQSAGFANSAPLGNGSFDLASASTDEEYGDVLSSSAEAQREGIAGERFAATSIRADFRDVMLWEPAVRTDPDGYARLEARFPDNITTWRLTARGIDAATRCGEASETFTARKNLMVRMETPRFATQGDRIVVATTVHNYLAGEKRVTLRMKGEDVALGDRDTTVTIAANGETRVDWNVSVTGVDSAMLTVKALTDEESDAAQTTLPITPRGLKVTASKAVDLGRDDHEATLEFDVPEATDPASRSISLSLSPSVGSSMIGALDDLIGYPYGCAEQTMSRFLPTIVVANVLRDLKLSFDKDKLAEMPKMVDKGLQALYGYQHADGGWGWWTNDATHPFMTAYIMYGLTVASRAGYEVPSDRYTRGLASLRRQIESRAPAGAYGTTPKTLDPTTEAYMLYVASFITRAKPDELYVRHIRNLASAEGVNSYGTALLTLAAHYQGQKELADNLAQRLVSMAKTTNGAAFWTGITWEHRWQDDNVETSAFAVRALIETGGQDGMLKRGVDWLVGQKRGNSWGNTRQSAMVVFTMADYLRTVALGDANFRITAKLNGRTVYERTITRDDLFAADQRVVIRGEDVRTGRNVVTIEKSGTGILHAAGWADYYVDVAQVRPADAGFAVTREYYLLRREKDGDAFVYVKEPFHGSVKSGEELFVKVRVRPDTAREYFLLEDPLPAGCEVVEDVSGYTITGEPEYQARKVAEGGTWKWWYSSRDVRDEKIAFFAQRLEARDYEFTYILRAQIPGEYSVMPSIGMLNYYPEVRGNSGAVQMMILK